jgi:hypothetical protein
LRSGVIAELVVDAVGVGADDGDRFDVLLQRQNFAGVFQQHDRFGGDLPGELAVGGVVDD